MKRKALLLIIPFAAAGLAACQQANPNPPGPTPDPQCESATVSITSAGGVTSIKPDATLQLTAEVNISGCTFSWSSSDKTIATVDEDGLVTGVKAGDVVINYGPGSFNLKVDNDAPTPPPAPVDDYGTEDRPLSVTQAVALIEAECPEDTNLTKQVIYCTGIVKEITKSGVYDPGDNYFQLVCTDNTTDVIVYRVHATDELKDSVQVGSQIKWVGYAKNFKGALEFVDNGGTPCTLLKIGDTPVSPTLVLSKTKETVKVGADVTINATVKNTENPVQWSLVGDSGSFVSITPNGNSVTIHGVAKGVAKVKAAIPADNLEALCEVEVKEDVAPASVNVEYSFNKLTKDDNNEYDGDEALAAFTDGKTLGDEIVTAVTPSKTYPGEGSLRVGSSSNGGSLEITTSANVTQVVVTARAYIKSGKPELNTISIGSQTETVEEASNEFVYDVSTTKSVTISTSKRVLIEKIGFVAEGVTPVTPSIEKVELNKTTLNLEPESSEQLTATVSVKGGAAQTVTWASDNTAVATVDSDGTVHAIAVGTAHITATSTVDTEKTASCTVNVKLPRVVSTVTIKDWPKEITAGQTISESQVKVDVTYTEGDPDLNVNPDSVKLTSIDANTASLVATVKNVDSEAVSVSVVAKEELTPVELTTTEGVSASEAKVNEIAAIKCGTGSASGSMKMTLPKGTIKLVFYAVGWNGEDTKITVSGLGTDKEIALASNAGIKGNSPFTLVDADPSDFRVEINLDSALAIQTKITVEATTGTRFALWNAGVKIETRTVTSVAVVGYPENIYVDDNITKEDITVNVTYDKGNPDTGVHPDSITLDVTSAGTKDLVATVGGVSSEPVQVEVLAKRTVSTVSIKAYPNEILKGADVSVEDVTIDVVWSSGSDSVGINPDSVRVVPVDDASAQLIATYGGVDSVAVNVSYKAEEKLTPITLTAEGGTSASEATVNEIAAIKCGTSNVKGVMKMSLPEGTKKLVFHAAGWKDVNTKITVSGLGSDREIGLVSNAGITSNTPFTLSEADPEDFMIEINLDSALASATTITVAATTGNRFVVWDAGVVLQTKNVSSVTITDYPKSVEKDAVIAKEDVKVTVTYEDTSTATDVVPDSITYDTSAAGTATLVATVGGVNSSSVNVTVIAPKVVSSVVITDYPESVEQNATIALEDVKVTITYEDTTTDVDVNPTSITCDTTKVGTATLVATVGGVDSDSVDVTVTAPVGVDYSMEFTNGKVPTGWTNNGGEAFSSTYWKLKGAGNSLTGKNLFDAQTSIDVTVVAASSNNGNAEKDNVLTVYALDKDGNKIEGVSATITITADANYSKPADALAAAHTVTVTLEGEGITGIMIEFTTKNYNVTFISCAIVTTEA